MFNTLDMHDLGAHFRVPLSTFCSHGTPLNPQNPTVISKPPIRQIKENLTKLSVRKFHPCFKVIRKQFTFYKIKPHFNLITLEILGADAEQSGLRNP